ncbi:MAG: hypothetical protein IPJ46_08990 [Anaerolineales bacterium]|nr:hypothetical protein [Anaerolineales bacterium]
MFTIQTARIFIVIHVLLSVICVFIILSGKTSLRKEQIIPMLLLPLFGPFMALVIEFLNVLGEQGNRPIDLEHLDTSKDILWKALKSYHEKGDIVPLEEAILINDVKTRRKFMLETLYDDPMKYWDVIMLAKNNPDVETSHYATTTIAYVQKQFQVSMQELAVSVEKNPDDVEILNKYLGTMKKYLESGLLEEHLLRNLRIVYGKNLDKKLIKVKNDKFALVEKVRNSIELREYTNAYEVSGLLVSYWPEDEQSWIEAVRVCIVGGDNKILKERLLEMQTRKINWTQAGKEQMAPWLQGAIL